MNQKDNFMKISLRIRLAGIEAKEEIINEQDT